MKDEYIVFTDGSSRGNPGPGGWGAIVATEYAVAELGGGEKHTTNNRMELSAVIHALSYVIKMTPKSAVPVVTLYLDSSYVMNGATKWIHGWQKKGWKTSAKDEVLNKDLWEELVPLLPRIEVKWELVKGHTGVEGNERCDVIATMHADGQRPQLYSGSRSSYTTDLTVKAHTSATKAPSKKKSKKGVAYSYVSEIGGVVKTHSSWADCEQRVKGKGGARYKKVFSQAEETELISLWKKGR